MSCTKLASRTHQEASAAQPARPAKKATASKRKAASKPAPGAKRPAVSNGRGILGRMFGRRWDATPDTPTPMPPRPRPAPAGIPDVGPAEPDAISYPAGEPETLGGPWCCCCGE